MTFETTPLSLIYRKRAALVSRQAEQLPNGDEMLKLLHQALSWIQLAENEEVIAASDVAVHTLS